MEVDGEDMRSEPLEERRKRLARLLSRSNKAMRQGIQLSEAITGDGAAIFRHACGLGLEGIVSKRIGSRYVSGRTRGMAEDEETRISSCDLGDGLSFKIRPV
jgi:bifunctional non-homologous end joining protein LigD